MTWDTATNSGGANWEQSNSKRLDDWGGTTVPQKSTSAGWNTNENAGWADESTVKPSTAKVEEPVNPQETIDKSSTAKVEETVNPQETIDKSSTAKVEEPVNPQETSDKSPTIVVEKAIDLSKVEEPVNPQQFTASIEANVSALVNVNNEPQASPAAPIEQSTRDPLNDLRKCYSIGLWNSC
jgi:hypothetical protein